MSTPGDAGREEAADDAPLPPRLVTFSITYRLDMLCAHDWDGMGWDYWYHNCRGCSLGVALEISTRDLSSLTWGDSPTTRQLRGEYYARSANSFTLSRLVAFAAGHMDPIELMVRCGRADELAGLGVTIPNWVWRNLQQAAQPLTKS